MWSRAWDPLFSEVALQGHHVPGVLPSEGAEALGVPVPRAHRQLATAWDDWGSWDSTSIPSPVPVLDFSAKDLPIFPLQ